MPVDIKRLTYNDLDLYKTLRFQAVKEEVYAFGKTYEEENAQPDSYHINRIEGCNNHNAVFFAFFESNATGMVYLTFTQDLKNRHSVELSGMYIKPEFRNKGIAQKLLDYSFEYLREFPFVTKVRLSIIEGRNEAANLYKKVGFNEVGQYKDELYINGSYFDEILFEKFL
jgi:ribosomal protein S18 acetylase RimI-like enzyme